MEGKHPYRPLSVIIPTIGRVELNRAVRSVLQQEDPQTCVEVIVVNDSGEALSPADWQASSKVTVINTNRRERSVARNTGAAAAKGDYLLFLDDDDWLAEGGMAGLLAAGRRTGAAWIYGVTQLVDRSGKPLIRLDHGLAGNCFTQVMAGEWIPLQASLIRTDAFFAVGGFNPCIAGPEDVDLARRMALSHDFARHEQVVAFVEMGKEDSSTAWDRHSQQSRWARESILDDPRAYRRMADSAPTAYWRGRIVRAYLTSSVWNLRTGRLFRGLGRLGMAARSVLAGGKWLLAGEYWRAVLKPYASITFAEAESRHLT